MRRSEFQVSVGCFRDFSGPIEQNGKNPTPKWIEKAADAFEGKIVAMPAREDIDYDVAEHLIVELYNK